MREMIKDEVVIDMILCARSGMTEKQISQKVHISECTVGSILEQARKKGIALPKKQRKIRRDWDGIVTKLAN